MSLYKSTFLEYVTGPGIFGLMQVLVEIWVFTFFESLICLKYTGKILDLLSQNSSSYERFNNVTSYGIFGRFCYTFSHKCFNAQEETVYLCNKLLSQVIILLLYLKAILTYNTIFLK